MAMRKVTNTQIGTTSGVAAIIRLTVTFIDFGTSFQEKCRT